MAILKPVSHTGKHCTFLVILKKTHWRRTARVATLNLQKW